MESPETNRLERLRQRFPRGPIDVTPRELLIGVIVFLAPAAGFIAASDGADPTVRLVAGAMAVGCASLIARLFPT